MPETATRDQLFRALSDPAYSNFSPEEKDQLFSHLVPDYKKFDKSEKQQFLSGLQRRYDESHVPGIPGGVPPAAGTPPKNPIVGATPQPSKSPSTVAKQPPSTATAAPPISPQPKGASPQIQSEEQKVAVQPKPKPGPAFVTPVSVTPQQWAGWVHKRRQREMEKAGIGPWMDRVASAVGNGDVKGTMDAMFSSPVFGTGQEREKNIKKLDNDLSDIFVIPIVGDLQKGAVEAAAQAATSPGNVALGALFEGAGAIAKAVNNPYVRATWKTASTALSAVFAGQQGTAAYQKGKEGIKQLQAKDYRGAAKTLGFASVDGLFAMLGGVGAVRVGLDIKRGIQEGIRIGKIKAILQDELYRQEDLGRAAEQEARKPKQITAPAEGEPPRPSAFASRMEAARRAAGKAFAIQPEESPPTGPAPEAAETQAASEEAPPTVTADNQVAPVVEPGTPPKQEIAKKALADSEELQKPFEQRRGTAFVPRTSLSLDAARFQYKRGAGKGGIVKDSLEDVTKWNPRTAGAISVWVDPKDGKTYVVNGHNRFALANRAENPPEDLEVRYIDAATAQEARLQGAIQNIAEKSGTALDAAQLFRESNYTLEDLRDQGLALSNKLASDGFGISKLAGPLYDAVMSGEMPEARAAIIGNGLPNPMDQISIAREIEGKEKAGRTVSDSTVKEMIRLANEGPQRTETQTDLFGTSESRRSLYTEMAEISDYARKQISTEKKLFGTVGEEAAAKRLGRSGNVIKAEENRLIAEQAAQAQALYDKLSGRASDVNQILREAAEDLADGKPAKQVKEAAYERIRESLSKTLPGREGALPPAIQRVPEVPPAGSGGTGGEPPATAGGQQPTVAKLRDNIKPLSPEAGVIRPSPEAVEKIRDFKEKLSDAGRAFKESIAPRSGVPEKGLTALMKALGERNQATFRLQQTMGEIEDAFDKLPRDQQIDFIDRMKTGAAQPTPQLQQIADTYKDLEEMKFQAIQRYNPSLTWKDNHFRVFWKKIPGEPVEERSGASGVGRRPFSGTRGFMKQASLANMSEGLRWDLDTDVHDLRNKIRAAGLQPNEYNIGQRPNPDNPLFDIAEFMPKSENAQRFVQDQQRSGMKIIRQGGEPWSYNPQVLFYRSSSDVMNYVSAQRMWEYLKDTGLRQYVKGPKEHPSEPTPEGFDDLNDRLAEVFFPARSGEGLVQPGRWVVERNVARLLNNYLSRDFLRDTYAAKGALEKTIAHTGSAMLKLKNILTAWELSVSPFHLIAESLEAVSTQMGIGFTRSWNQGVRELDAGQFGKGLAEAVGAPVSPYTAAKYGGDVIRAAIAEMMPSGSPPPEGSFGGNVARAVMGRQRQVTPDDIRIGGEFMRDNPEAIQHFNDLMMAGLRLDMSPDYRINTLRAFWNSFEQAKSGQRPVANSIMAAIRLFPAINEVLMKPLFEMYIPRLKIGFAMKDYAQQIEEHADEIVAGKVTKSELARRSVDRMENRFGEMNFDNLFWNRTMKTALQIQVRSVTWRLGTIRAFGGAATGQANYLADPVRLMIEQAKSQSGIKIDKSYIAKLHPNMGWLLGLAFTTAVLGEIMARLATGKGPEQWASEAAAKSHNFLGELTREYLHPRIDTKLDDRGKPHRVTPPTYLARDLEPLLKDPSKYIRGGSSSLLQNTPEVWNNQDFFGNFVFDPNDPMLKQVIAGAGHIIGLPFVASTFVREKQSGASKAQEIAGLMGFPAASRSVDLSKAEQLALSLNRTKYKMTPGELEGTQERRELTSKIRSGEPGTTSTPEWQSLSSRQKSSIRKKTSRSYLEQQVSQLGIRDALAVWDAATSEERNEIRRTLERKRHLIAHIHDKRQREEAERKFDAIFPPASAIPPVDYAPPSVRVR